MRDLLSQGTHVLSVTHIGMLITHKNVPAGCSNFVSQDGMRFSTLEIIGRAPRAFRAEQISYIYM